MEISDISIGWKSREVPWRIVTKGDVTRDDFEPNIVALKSLSCNMARRTIFIATFRCRNMLQVFASDSNLQQCCRILLELVCDTFVADF